MPQAGVFVTDKRHTYSIRLDWTGNQGIGTSAYRAYSRAHEISARSSMHRDPTIVLQALEAGALGYV
jgi:hypothetical protein